MLLYNSNILCTRQHQSERFHWRMPLEVHTISEVLIPGVQYFAPRLLLGPGPRRAGGPPRGHRLESEQGLTRLTSPRRENLSREIGRISGSLSFRYNDFDITNDQTSTSQFCGHLEATAFQQHNTYYYMTYYNIIRQ